MYEILLKVDGLDPIERDFQFGFFEDTFKYNQLVIFQIKVILEESNDTIEKAYQCYHNDGIHDKTRGGFFIAKKENQNERKQLTDQHLVQSIGYQKDSCIRLAHGSRKVVIHRPDYSSSDTNIVLVPVLSSSVLATIYSLSWSAVSGESPGTVMSLAFPPAVKIFSLDRLKLRSIGP